MPGQRVSGRRAHRVRDGRLASKRSDTERVGHTRLQRIEFGNQCAHARLSQLSTTESDSFTSMTHPGTAT